MPASSESSEQSPDPATAGPAGPGRLAIAVGLTALALVLAGVIVALLAGGDSGGQGGQAAPAPLTSGPPASGTPPPLPASSTTADQAGARAVADTLAHAIATGDAAEFGTVTCRPQTPAELDRLRKAWADAGTLTAMLAGPPEVTGSVGSVTVRVQVSAGLKDTRFPLVRENGAWCVPG